MLENKPSGYDDILESLTSLMSGVVPSVDKSQKNLQDITTEYRVFVRDNQTWSWLRYTNFALWVEKDFTFYQNDPRYKNWVAYYLRNEETLRTLLNIYRTQAYNLLIAIQQKSVEKSRTYQELTNLITPKKTGLENCNGKNKLTLEKWAEIYNEKDRSYSISSLVNNDTNDTVKVYRAMGDLIYKKSQLSIAPNSLKVLEHRLRVKLYFFRKDSCIGYTSHTKYNQLITIK
jgi:hypothetical protein